MSVCDRLSYCCHSAVCTVQVKKKLRKLFDFWADLGATVEQSAEQTERLFKNLAADYQKLKQQMHISGCATDGQPALRNSQELFIAYENFYML